MIRIFAYSPFLSVVIILSLFSACELETLPPSLPDLRPASTLVINEVFTLPQNHPSRYTWVEFLNPTTDTIDLTNWTLSFFTSRLQLITIGSLDSLGNFTFFRQTGLSDSVGILEVPFAGGLFEDTVHLLPGALFTIVSNEARLLDHTEWGSADERFRRERPLFEGPITSVDTIFSSPDSTVVSVTFPGYFFSIQPKEQLVLKDPSGKIVDVVRMGDSVYTNVIGDSTYSHPLLGPLNRSIGSVPEFESIARYRGGYFTGNTANDFFITCPRAIPIPHENSQASKDDPPCR